MRTVVLYLWIASAFPVLAFENCTNAALSELEKCSATNYQQEDRKLNSLYNEALIAAVQDKEPIKNAQRKWLKARDSQCVFTPQDGAEYKVYQNSCLYELTRERNRELEVIITHQRATGVTGEVVQYRYDEKTHKITVVGDAKNSAIYFKKINKSNFNGWVEFIGEKPAIVYDNNSVMNYSTYVMLGFNKDGFFIDCIYLDVRSGYNGVLSKEGVCGLSKPISGDFSKYEEYVYSIVNTHLDKVNLIDTTPYRESWVNNLSIILMRSKEHYVYKFYTSKEDLLNGNYIIRECFENDKCRDYKNQPWIILDSQNVEKVTLLQDKIINDRLNLVSATSSVAEKNSNFTPFTISAERAFFYSDDYQKRKSYLIKNDKVNLVSMTEDKKWCRVQYINASNKSIEGNISCEELNK